MHSLAEAPRGDRRDRLPGAGARLAHPRRRRRRHRHRAADDLERGDRPRPAAEPGRRGAARAVAAGLEGVRAGGDARRGGQLRRRLHHRERRPDGRAHRRQHHGGARRRRSPTASCSTCATWRGASCGAVGVKTGGANVQFAVDPRTGDVQIIEMNPRVSRSSALASKATGFPIAKLAALVAVGYTLDEIRNDITGVTPASFEPSLDYCVVKIPRWNFEKFPGADATLGPQMKSVGEVMAIGRTFPEALNKAIRGLEIGLDGFSADLARPPRRQRRAGLPAHRPAPLPARRPARARPRRRPRRRRRRRLRPLVHRAAHPHPRRRGRICVAAPELTPDAAARGQADGLLRPRHRPAAAGWSEARRAPRDASPPGVRAVLLPRRHLRRRVRRAHALPLLLLRARLRGRAHATGAR